MTTRTPVYFLSHGGPNIMEDTKHPAYAKLQEIGHEITGKVKPKAIVVFSGHWQGFQDTIEVNTMESSPLIYDFYGFPAHYYEYKYPNKGSPELAEKILGMLQTAGIKAEGVRRGLDHGVWASFMCLFDPKTNPLDIPIVQVSLFDYFKADLHFKLGKAIASLREEGVQIIVSGMAVHNLRDMGRMWGQPGALDYTLSFDEALREAVEQDPSSREEAMTQLLSRPDFKKAHPSADHLMPIYVGAGAASDEKATRIFTLPEGSMSWAQFRFGEVGAPAS
ncbi:related to aromatic ring-opening dioxygenase LigB subunit, putative [Ramularia collo-cygni]|uniref:Related to aromatic ring-opening dioxygenase LigB subunit, putative n=1 Tax=Ramularia collo-cygni TaxID=112498 RepID=A0A2D3V5S7_9PEZI|nr:related to aromatic ring-opening dioxygenase LigB subunit, putative [Ramularia collo-cygni]CZT16839.1 related to aromatic ring-opening dioxygenase LigB subunit, putative [Ramularia collo-cygni]